MPHEVEVSWQLLRQVVREWAGASAELEEVTPLAGGCINTTLALRTKEGEKAVLKITPHRVDLAYADEAHQLQVLREAGLPVPSVYRCKIGSLEEPFSYILLEFVEGMDLAAAKNCCSSDELDQIQGQLAELVLVMHDHRSPHYMRLSAAEPKRYERWAEFYHDVFDGICRELTQSNTLAVKSKKTVMRVHERLDRLLAHTDCPRLVHWDIWATNIMVREVDGRWRIAAFLDPNCKYAHAEAELAYLDLFHTSTPTFLKVYQQQFKLPAEYHQIRKPVYQLYSLMNHLQLFGQEYLKPLMGAIERVGALV